MLIARRLHCGLTLVVLLIPSAAAAQFPDLANLSAQYMGNSALADSSAQVQVSSYDAAINVPIPLAESTFLIPGISYHVESVSFSGDTGFAPLRAFHSLEVPLLFVQLLPHDWAFSARIATTLAGDFQQVDDSMLLLSAVLLATHSFNDQFVFGFGGIASYSFGTLLPLPALYVDWKPVQTLQFEAFIPAFAHLKLLVGDRFEVGVRGEISGNSYGIRDERVRGQWPCSAHAVDDPATAGDETIAEQSQCLDHIAYSFGSVGIVGAVRLFHSVWLEVLVSKTVFRRYDAQNSDDEPIDGSQDLPQSFLFRGSLSWRIPRS